MTYRSFIGGKLIETTGGNYNIYSGENIIYNSVTTVTEKGIENGISFGEPKSTPSITLYEKVVSIKCELYMHNNQTLKIPYLDEFSFLNFKSSKLFIAGLRSIFGQEIKHSAIKRFMLDLKNNKIIYPRWEVNDGIAGADGGCYNKGTIYLNEKLILEAEKDPIKSWLLFRIMIEETGHYIEDLLRNKYDSIGGDSNGDEGKLFAADFIKFNNLLLKDFTYANFEIKSEDGTIRQFDANVLTASPNIEIKSSDLLFVSHEDDDHGIVTLQSGEKITVEFFKIRGAGAVHEDITKRAAKKAGVTYDYRLDEGCAWPDVPCEDENSIETCYYKTWRNEHKKGTLAYESHHGSKQFWHSMAPTGKNTNQQVVNLSIDQAKIWFKQGLEKKGDDGLFFVGKVLHMVQDSYSRSHIQRNENNQIIQIQGYEAQDPDKHGAPDKEGDSKEAKNAEEASVAILMLYKSNKELIEKNNDKKIIESIKFIGLSQLEIYLRLTVYPLAKGRGSVQAGGSLEAYKK